MSNMLPQLLRRSSMHKEQQKPNTAEVPLNSLSDEDVINLVRDGHTAYYELIIRRYNQRLFRLARSILLNDAAAQDAMQEAYISAFYNLDVYQSSGKLGAWLSRITVNEALMIKRKTHSKITMYADALDTQSLKSEQPSPLDKLANDELSGLIEYAVDALPDEFRSVFILRGIQQLSVSETADSLGLNQATVKTRYLRARKKLQKQLDRHIRDAGLHAFEFAGKRCNQMVHIVLNRISQNPHERKPARTTTLVDQLH